MDNQNNENDVVKHIEEWARDRGVELIEPRAFFDGVDKLYRKPSLSQVVDEEMPRIIDADPSFFEKYGIDLPENQEVRLFDLYYDKHGKEGLERVYHGAKVWFRHLRFFLVDHPNQTELNHAVEEYKRILEGNYLTD